MLDNSKFVSSKSSFRYLEDLVGKDTAAKVRAYQGSILKEFDRESALINGYSQDRANKIHTAFRFPLNKDENFFKLCRYIRTTHSPDGELKDVESFYGEYSPGFIQGFSELFLGLFSREARERNHTNSQKLYSYKSFNDFCDETVGKLIEQVPIVVCPISVDVIGAHFGRQAIISNIQGDHVNTEDYFSKSNFGKGYSVWNLKELAYSQRIDAVAIEYPSGYHAFVKFGPQKSVEAAI